MSNVRLGLKRLVLLFALSILVIAACLPALRLLFTPIPEQYPTNLEIKPDFPQAIPPEDELLNDPKLSVLFARGYSKSSYVFLRIAATGACNCTYETGDMYHGKKIVPGWKQMSLPFGEEKFRRLVGLLHSCNYFQLGKRYFLPGQSGGEDVCMIVKGSKFRKDVHCTYFFPLAVRALETFFDEQVFAGVDFSQGEPCARDPLWNGPNDPLWDGPNAP